MSIELNYNTICAPGTNLVVLGLMSGTSMDGIDVALVDIRGSAAAAGVDFRGFRCYPYPAEVREGLHDLAAGRATGTVACISSLNFVLGNLYADAVIDCVAELGVDLRDVDLVASHGQTIFHQGTPTGQGCARVASTLQIGEAAVIAERTGLTVVSDFRTADMAAGGQGAPLVPYFDFVYLRHERATRMVQNIGGIANVTYLPAGCALSNVVAFDNGPGNMLIDAAASHFTEGRLSCDLDGRMAARGRVNAALLARLLEHPYYSKRPPKSAGREQFGVHYLHETLAMREAEALSDEDIIATLTALTAESIAASYANLLPGVIDEVIVSGGGVNNPALISMLEKACGRSVTRFDDFGIPSDAKEAVAFALLASETVRGVPSNVPSTTGAAHPAVLGKITPGRR